MDMTQVIQPKADELTADDLIAGPRTIRITAVDIKPGTERPVAINFDGDEGRPFRPCKTVSRILVTAWGPDANAYIGRRATLYRDGNVKWGGMAVGGIRISHLSNIEREIAMALTATKGKKTITTVKPLAVEQATPQKVRQTAEEWAAEHIAAVEAARDVQELTALENGAEKAMTKLATGKPDLHVQVMTAYATKLDAFNMAGEVIDADGVIVEGEA